MLPSLASKPKVLEVDEIDPTKHGQTILNVNLEAHVWIINNALRLHNLTMERHRSRLASLHCNLFFLIHVQNVDCYLE